MTFDLIQPDNTTFVLLCFEGPDRYSLAGGLGVRVSELSQVLAEHGFETHLIFIGDPNRPGREVVAPRLTLHRWGQWLSAYYQAGVYDGEAAKVTDYTASVPAFVLDRLLAERLRDSGYGVVLAEEWHTAGAMIALAERAQAENQSARLLRLWNANNTYSFDGIDWQRLARAATVTAVSRYMKQILRERGLETHVIPNGIPRRMLAPVEPGAVAALRAIFGDDLLLVKVARWDPDKGWLAAVEAVAELKAAGVRPRFIMRGGIEPHGGEVLARARQLGLVVADVTSPEDSAEGYLQALAEARDADVLNCRTFIPEAFLRVLFAAADGVLANSRHEPFGLVGLEVMAAGGIAFTGSTGEDYAHPQDNAMVLDTEDPMEIVGQLLFLRDHPALATAIRCNGQRTATHYTWDHVLPILLQKLNHVARTQARQMVPPLVRP